VIQFPQGTLDFQSLGDERDVLAKSSNRRRRADAIHFSKHLSYFLSVGVLNFPNFAVKRFPGVGWLVRIIFVPLACENQALERRVHRGADLYSV
jgi:hypothetical protein